MGTDSPTYASAITLFQTLEKIVTAPPHWLTLRTWSIHVRAAAQAWADDYLRNPRRRPGAEPQAPPLLVKFFWNRYRMRI